MVEASGGSKIVVAESGNKRKTITPEDAQQCIKDLSGWFQTNATDYFNSKLKDCQGAPAADVAKTLDEFGAGTCLLGVALQKYNGNLQYQDTFVGLTLSEISGHAALKDKGVVPFAKDIDGTLLCVQIQGGKESVITWDSDESAPEQDFKMSYGEYIESIREKLLTGKLMYEDGLGLVQIT